MCEANASEREKMMLAVSIGNTAIAVGGVTARGVGVRFTVSAKEDRTADEYALLFRDLLALRGASPDDFSHAMLASVCPALTETVKDALVLLLGKRVFRLTSGCKTGLSILTENPAELGADLVASAAGASALYAPPFLLIDLGTATTLCAVDRNGAFIGCAIAPGISLAGKALSDTAALLPDVDVRPPLHAIGKSTVESMRSGAIYGAAAMIDGMVTRMEKEMGEDDITVILSGASADAILPHMCRSAVRNDDLIFRGLYEIDRRNRRK